MTDGIIQQVFNKYHKAYFRLNYSNIDYESLMRAIEQELIEKIDKTFGNTQFDLSERAIKRLLIGDNKE